MATITIKNVPDDLHQRLKERAQRHRRSMNSEAIVCLEAVLTPARRDAEALIAEAERGDQLWENSFSSDFIQQAKREGRA